MSKEAYKQRLVTLRTQMEMEKVQKRRIMSNMLV